MEIKYTLDGMTYYRQAKLYGDLLRYYGDIRFKFLEKVKKIQENKGYSALFLNYLRKHSSAGITLENLISGLETVSELEIYQFKVNGKNLTDCFTTTSPVLEIYMNPLYFQSLASISHAITPKKIPKIAKKEEGHWIMWFERELRKYHPPNKWKKSVLVK